MFDQKLVELDLSSDNQNYGQLLKYYFHISCRCFWFIKHIWLLDK